MTLFHRRTRFFNKWRNLFSSTYSELDVDIFGYYISGPGVLSFSIKPENTNYDGEIRLSNSRFKFNHFVKPTLV